MATDTLEIFGTEYTGVVGIKATDSSNNTKTYINVSDTTATASDVASGKYFYTSSGVKTAGTSSGGGGGSTTLATISLPYANWTTSQTNVYTQTVTVTGANSSSKIDLQPDATALLQLMSDGVQALYISNNNGTFTAYAIGAATTANLTLQASITATS